MKSNAAVEILTVCAAIDEGKNLHETVNILLGKSLDLTIVTNSKDLYTSLLTQKNSIDWSICADVNIISYEFETGFVTNIVWIRGSTNPADPAPEQDSALAETLCVMLHSGILPVDFSKAKISYRK